MVEVFISKAYFCQQCGKWISEKEVFQEIRETAKENTYTLKIICKCVYCGKPIYMEIVTKIK